MRVRTTAAIILYKDGKILLQHRSVDAPSHPNLWGCFGGGIEEGETPEQAVRREALEELEYVLHSPRHIDMETREHDDRKEIVHTFVEQYDGSPLVLHEGQAYGWFTIEDAMKLDLTLERREQLERLADKLRE